MVDGPNQIIKAQNCAHKTAFMIMLLDFIKIVCTREIIVYQVNFVVVI